METVAVNLGARSYEVLAGVGLLNETAVRLGKVGFKGRCAIVTDSNVGPLYAGALAENLTRGGFQPVTITVPSGEHSKSLACAESLCDQMIAAGLDRGAFLIALGGGVVGDLAGFVAAIYYRGIPFVQIPTTVLAQVDSSVGGKTGVNAHGGKNLIGAFHQPRLVLADVETLRTLPPREFNEGFAEIIKHAAIRDRTMLGAVAEIRDATSPTLAALIARNIAIKAAIVSADEHETTGERALLNFGHTIGHAIENAAGYGRFLHGEAISLGLTAACSLSEKKAALPTADTALVLARLHQFALPTRLDDDISTESIMAALTKDKKFAQGRVRFVLSPRLGEAFVSEDVTLEEIHAEVEALRA